MLVDREKEWNSYKMEVVIKKGGRELLWKLIGKGSTTTKCGCSSLGPFARLVNSLFLH
jgi:hypothetical protein